MNRQENLIIYMLFMGSLMLQRIVSQHCKGDIYSDYQMMLKGHTTIKRLLKFDEVRLTADKPVSLTPDAEATTCSFSNRYVS